MSASPSCDPHTDTEYRVMHNPEPTGLEDLRGLLTRLQSKDMTPMLPGKDSHSQRQQLYEQFALVAMLIKTQTPETRIQFIDIARLLKPDIYPSIGKDHIVKIFVKWIILKPTVEELREIPAYMSMVSFLLYYMAMYEHTERHIYQYIPDYDPIEINLSMSLAGVIYGQETPEKRLWIRDVCLELAMTMKDTPKIRVLFLDLAYYFEPTFRMKLMKYTSEDNVNLEIKEQWQIIQNQIYFRNRNVNYDHETKALLNRLQYDMNSYTQKRGYAVWPTRNTHNTTGNRGYPKILYPRNI